MWDEMRESFHWPVYNTAMSNEAVLMGTVKSLSRTDYTFVVPLVCASLYFSALNFALGSLLSSAHIYLPFNCTL